MVELLQSQSLHEELELVLGDVLHPQAQGLVQVSSGLKLDGRRTGSVLYRHLLVETKTKTKTCAAAASCVSYTEGVHQRGRQPGAQEERCTLGGLSLTRRQDHTLMLHVGSCRGRNNVSMLLLLIVNNNNVRTARVTEAEPHQRRQDGAPVDGRVLETGADRSQRSQSGVHQSWRKQVWTWTKDGEKNMNGCDSGLCR